MARTAQEYFIPSPSVERARSLLRHWLQIHGFRILNENTDGTVRRYHAPEVVLQDRVGAHLPIQCAPGGFLWMNPTASLPDWPVAYCFYLTPHPNGVRVRGEFFFPGVQAKSLFDRGTELEMANSIYKRAGVQRKIAYPLFEAFGDFMTSLNAPLK